MRRRRDMGQAGPHEGENVGQRSPRSSPHRLTRSYSQTPGLRRIARVSTAGDRVQVYGATCWGVTLVLRRSCTEDLGRRSAGAVEARNPTRQSRGCKQTETAPANSSHPF